MSVYVFYFYNEYEFFGKIFYFYMCIMLGKRKKGRRLLVKSIEVLKSNMKDECISIGDLVVEKDYIQVVFNY